MMKMALSMRLRILCRFFFYDICHIKNEKCHRKVMTDGTLKEVSKMLFYMCKGGVNMKYVILVSHGEFAKGLKTSLDMLAGQRDDVIASGLEDGKTADEFAVVFENDIAKVQEDDQVVLLADIIGGSPLTTALNVLDKKGMLKNTIALGGMNLPLALTTVLMKDNLEGEMFVSTVISEATSAIKHFQTSVTDDEDDI